MEAHLLAHRDLSIPRWRSPALGPSATHNWASLHTCSSPAFISRHAGRPTHQVPTAGPHAPPKRPPDLVALPLPISFFLLPTPPPTPALCKADLLYRRGALWAHMQTTTPTGTVVLEHQWATRGLGSVGFTLLVGKSHSLGESPGDHRALMAAGPIWGY